MNKIIVELANRHGVTPESIEHEMRGALREAMQSRRPEACSFWERLSPNGEEPNLEMILDTVSDMVINNMRNTLKERAK